MEQTKNQTAEQNNDAINEMGQEVIVSEDAKIKMAFAEEFCNKARDLFRGDEQNGILILSTIELENKSSDGQPGIHLVFGCTGNPGSIVSALSEIMTRHPKYLAMMSEAVDIATHELMHKSFGRLGSLIEEMTERNKKGESKESKEGEE